MTESAETTLHPLAFYSAFLQAADTANAATILLAAKRFDSLFADAPSPEADSGFVLFTSLYDKTSDFLNEQHIKDPVDYKAYISANDTIEAPVSAKAAKQVKSLEENGFKIAISEGSTYIKQERSFLSKYFYPHVSAAMRSYLVQSDKENEEGLIDEGSLQITPTELSNRVLYWDDFIKVNPSFVFLKEVKDNQRSYLTFLLEGTDNTPLIDFDSNMLNNNYEEAFKNMLQKSPQSRLANLVKPYYFALKQQDLKTAQKLLREYSRQGIILDFTA